MPDRNYTRVFSLVILAACLLASACGGGGGGGSSQPTTNPLASVSGLSPSSATVGAAAQTLAINGTNFLSNSTVTYNSIAHAATFVNSTQLTISLSAADQATAGSYGVVVTNPAPGGGASNLMNFAVDNLGPSLTSLSPASALVGTGAQTLTLTGTNFLSTSTVTYNGVGHPATFVNSTQLTISLSASDQATVGSYPLVVANPSPGGGASNPSSFAVNNPTPTISSFSPTDATVASGAFTLTVNGTGFISTSVVYFNGTAETTTFVSSTQITAVIPASAVATVGNPSVTVTTPTPGGGTAQAPLSFQVDGGVLSIAIIDLPASAPANVMVSGPNGYSTILTASQTLQVAAGAYTVVANSVGVAQSNYYPVVATQAGTVSNMATTSLTVDYSTIIPTTTKVLDSAGMSSLTVSPDGSTITLSTSSAVAQSLAVGNVLATAPTTAAPDGLLVKILSLGTSGQTIIASVEQATLEDAIQQATFQFTETLGPGNTQADTRALLRNRALFGQALGAPYRKDSSGGVCAGNTNTIQLPFNVPLAQQGIASLTLSGESDFCPSFVFNLQITSFKLVSLNASVTVGIHTSINLVDSLESSFNVTKNLTTLKGEPVEAIIGGVPIMVQPSLTIFVGASGSATANAVTGLTGDSTVTVGVSYADGAWSPVDTSTTPATLSSTTSVDGTVSLKGWAGVTGAVTLDGFLTPSLSTDGYLQFAAGINNNPCWTLTAGLEGNVALTASILGKTLASYTSPTLNLYSTPVSQATTTCFAPTLSSITPNMAQIMSPQFTLALSGSNFVPDSVVNFNGQPLATTFVDPSDLTAVVPVGDLSVPGTFPVTVNSPDNPGGTSTPATFTIAPVTDFVSPTSASVPGCATQQFTATVQGSSDTAVTWTVNGISGGNSTVGTITPQGLYRAPAAAPNPATITVTATSQADSSISASASVTITTLSYNFTTVASPVPSATQASGVNTAGQIVGYYSGGVNIYHGFINTGGTFSSIDYPGVTVTFANGINDGGQIVGTYNDGAGNPHGFLYVGGSFSSIDYLGAVHGGGSTSASGINDGGQIVGIYGDNLGYNHGFLYAGGIFSSFDYPGALWTQARSINDSGQIVGDWETLQSVGSGTKLSPAQGFLYADGSFSSINYPGAAWTIAQGINDSGLIVGYYSDNVSGPHVFLYAGGSFSSIDYPGATATFAFGINSSGQIVGQYSDGNGWHGFLATPSTTCSAH